MRARFGVGGGVDTNAGGAGGEQNNVKDISHVKTKPPAQELAACEQLVAGGAIIVEKDLGAGRDAPAPVSPIASDSFASKTVSPAASRSPAAGL